jgi:hypothetical protein
LRKNSKISYRDRLFGFIIHCILGRYSQAGGKAMLETGAEAMKATALHFHFYIEVSARRTEEKKRRCITPSLQH